MSPNKRNSSRENRRSRDRVLDDQLDLLGRELADAMESFDADESLDSAPGDMLDRCGSIPLLFDPPTDTRLVDGRVSYDSWSQGPSVPLRDRIDGHIRKLRLRAGDYQIEMVAEKRDQRWEFTARIYRRERVVHDFVLKVGGRSLMSQSGGFFVWNSLHVPRVLRAISHNRTLEFEDVSW